MVSVKTDGEIVEREEEGKRDRRERELYYCLGLVL